MDNKLLKKFFIAIFIITIFLFLNPKITFAGSQKLNNLDFDIEITESGDLKIKETWDVYIEETNTLFKTFPIDESYDEISDVTVVEVLNSGGKKDFSRRYDYAYHVEEDCYQALINQDNDFEIAWGVNVSGSDTRTFEIAYTVKNHVTLYNDCAEIYWKLIGEDFGIDSKKITGNIDLPSGISDINDLRIWAHGPLNGSIKRVSANNVSFEVEDLPSNTFLEIRLAMPTKIFELSNKMKNMDKLEQIIEEETVWANEANAKRERLAKQETFYIMLVTVVGIIVVIISTKKFLNIIKN